MGVAVKERRTEGRSLKTSVVQAPQSAKFFASGGEGEASIVARSMITLPSAC